jgi:hypothetical protein
MLRIQFIGGFNPFAWPDFCCPLCEHREFTSLGHAGVYCDECNARFNVRDTAGDPGCVVDCFCTREQGGFVYAPAYICEKCEDYPVRHGLFDWQEKTCRRNLNHGDMTRDKGVSVPWKVLPQHERFYLILKTGDYCSGWLDGSSHTPKRLTRRGPTQEQWEAFQEHPDFRNCSLSLVS